MKPVHIAQISFHILHIFAQVLYFAHFSRLNVFSKGLLVLTFYKIKINFNRPKRKLIMKEEKKMDGCLNEEHVKYTTWILSARHPYFV